MSNGLNLDRIIAGSTVVSLHINGKITKNTGIGSHPSGERIIKQNLLQKCPKRSGESMSKSLSHTWCLKSG
ncbi:uncharacterized protein N7506_010634 [Penicillium brevicompactum]|uniref:uncharacterized protein n=1 Tax=Penicillium brevicompactum TaxID=5074 RepID=UPI0025407AC3|nr:uncharacterized protein N7506_010634 [Penicillium brevicompactum]KAJ5327532.1 hypothetical protein N7506_010634 [Penicillium brevicompactum]